MGVDGPFLVIAPRANPMIRLDARLLDRVELIGRSAAFGYATSVAMGLGSAAALIGMVPGSIYVAGGLAFLAQLRFRRSLAHAAGRDLLLAIGNLEVMLHVADGVKAARAIAEQLAPYTREVPITRADVYEDARRRLDVQMGGKKAEDDDRGLFVGSDLVSVERDKLIVGEDIFPVSVVREYALRGANLPLEGGRRLQAAMGLLVVAAHERALAGEDLESLHARISAYEQWSGHGAGR
jgi:hypothetical protein